MGVQTRAAAWRKDLAFVPTRGALGATMLYHGLGKLRRDRQEQTAQWFESIGVRPGRGWALATGIAELGAGALALAGFLTRPAALAVLVTQGTAVAKVHAAKGFDSTRGGYEWNLALMAIAAALLVAGPGRLSLHELVEHALARRRRRARMAGACRAGLGARLVHLLE